jgi:serine/threonine protein kinase
MENISDSYTKSNSKKSSSRGSTSSSGSSSSSSSSGSTGSTGSTDSSEKDYSDNGNEFIGDVINNQYILLYKIGYGSFSSVWLVYDISNDNFYALKIQTPDDYDEGIKEIKIYDMINRLCTQNKNLDTLMLLKSTFILEKDDNKYVCMVMDLMAGSLYDIIKTDKYKNGLGEEVIKRIDTQLTEAVKVLHNFDIIHTDIKPENVLVCGINKKYQTVIDSFKKLKLKEKYDSNINEIKQKYNLKNKKHKEKLRQDKYLILLELNKFIHEIIDFDTILSDRTSDLFTEDQINNIKIKLADFGSILYERELKKDKWFPEITTRYYRDPRVVLGLNYDKTVDLHAIKCTLHEMQTGKILYNPDMLKDENEQDNEKDFSIDYYHVLLFIKNGLVKPEWLKNCKNDDLKLELKEEIKKFLSKSIKSK